MFFVVLFSVLDYIWSGMGARPSLVTPAFRARDGGEVHREALRSCIILDCSLEREEVEGMPEARVKVNGILITGSPYRWVKPSIGELQLNARIVALRLACIWQL